MSKSDSQNATWPKFKLTICPGTRTKRQEGVYIIERDEVVKLFGEESAQWLENHGGIYKGNGDRARIYTLADSICDTGPDLYSALKKTKAFLDDLSKSNPGWLGKLVLQDYAQYNEAMLEMAASLRKAEGK